MAEKVFTKFFENFRGLDLRASDLTRKPEYSSQLDNLILDRTQTLIGRKGFKAASQHIDPGSFLSRIEYPSRGLYNYTFLNSKTGATEQELIGLGDSLYKLEEGTMTIAYGGAGTAATFSFLPSALGWILDLKVDGVSQAGFPLGVTHNTTVTPTTFSQLRTLINAVAGFTCTLTPWAQVNGNQVGRDVNNAITVDAGHTVSISTQEPTTLEVINSATGRHVFLDFIAQGATTLTPALSGATIDVADNNEIGVAHTSIFALPTTEATSVKPTATFTFTYWKKIFYPTDGVLEGGYNEARTSSPFTGSNDAFLYTGSPYTNLLVDDTSADTQNISAAIVNNTMYLASYNPVDYDYKTGIGATFDTPPYRQSSLLQYDGQQMIEASLKQSYITGLSLAPGAGMGTGTYKYLTRTKFINQQGQIFYSSDSLMLKETTITTTAGNNRVNVGLFGESYATGAFFYPSNFARKNGTQAGVTTLVVDSPPVFRVGDDCCFIDRATAIVERRKITALSATSITISGAPVTVNDNDFISNNITIEIFRTNVFGNQYFLLQELPMEPGSTNFIDSSADTALLIKYDGPFLGTNRRDSAPVVTYITSHQGALAGVGDRLNPNTAFWSVPGEPFAWPAGTNNTDLTSSVGGVLTSIGSDNENTLIAGKADSYYAISGDLGTAQVSLTTSSEGDVGIPGHSSLVKARESLVYLSNKGPRVSLGGSVDGFGDRLVSAFFNINKTIANNVAISDPSKLVMQRAVSGHDLDGQKILFWVGGETGTPNDASATLRPSDNNFVFVYDYANDIFSKYTFTTEDPDFPYNMAGGIASYKGDLYFISRFIPTGGTDPRGALYKFNNDGTQYDYHDDSYKIVHTWRPSHDTGDEPSVNKEFLRLKVYSFLPPSLEFTSFNLILNTYKDFMDSSGSLVHFTTIYSFTSVSQKEKIAKLRSDKMRVCLFEFIVSTIFQSPRITGYEYVIALPYKKDDLS